MVTIIHLVTNILEGGFSTIFRTPGYGKILRNSWRMAWYRGQNPSERSDESLDRKSSHLLQSKLEFDDARLSRICRKRLADDDPEILSQVDWTKRHRRAIYFIPSFQPLWASLSRFKTGSSRVPSCEVAHY